LRILHWFPNFAAGGGVANAVSALADAQAAAGGEVWIVTRPARASLYGPTPTRSDLQFAYWGGDLSLRLGAMRVHRVSHRDRAALRRIQPDVVHVHAEFNPDNWWVRRLWPSPIVLSPHGAFHPAVLARGGRSKGLFAAVAKRALWNGVACFHALNPAEATDVAKRLPHATTYCVPHGPSPAVVAALASTDAYPTDTVVRFMFIGRLDVTTKGLDILVESFARALNCRGGPAATLTLVGPEWHDGGRILRELIDRLGVSDVVGLYGSVNAPDVPATLRRCDVYVQLSRNEGSPLSLNDALVLGKPAIISDRVGTISIPEIAALEHVVVVEPSIEAAAHAISQAMVDIARLRAAARQSEGFIRQVLSWERAAESHLRQYEGLIMARRLLRAGEPLR
jgi:glycosyltransferase involved in cell wall biosynthesis